MSYILSIDGLFVEEARWGEDAAVEVVISLSFALVDEDVEPTNVEPVEPEATDPEEGGEEEDETWAELSAQFRLAYTSVDPDPTARKELATRRALADVWPMFVGWLDPQLGALGLSPAKLGPRPPAELADEADEVYAQED